MYLARQSHDHCCPIQDRTFYVQIQNLEDKGKTREASDLAKTLCEEGRYHHGVYEKVSPSLYSKGGIFTEKWSCWNCDWSYAHTSYIEHTYFDEEEILKKLHLKSTHSNVLYSPETIKRLHDLNTRLTFERVILEKKQPWFFKNRWQRKLRSPDDIKGVQSVLSSGMSERRIDYFHRSPGTLPVKKLAEAGYFLASQEVEKSGRFHAVFKSGGQIPQGHAP